jgi:uncharacterized membrane protein YqjE
MAESGSERAGGADRSTRADPPSQEERTRSSAGVRDLLGRLAASVLSALDTRVQLAALEFAEERARTRDTLVLAVVAAIACGFALLGANALFVVLAWERLGWVALLLPTLAWAAIAALAAWRLTTAWRREERPFAATLAEFSRDRAFFAERFRKEPR